MSKDIIIPGDEAYLSFGGWAKPMKNPPGMHERRRYVVDVECTVASLTSSGKGERGTRKLSILRVFEVAGANVPPKPKNDEEDMDTPPMFAADGTIPEDPQSLAEAMAGDGRDVEASADEGDEIMAERREAKEAAEAAGDDGVVDAEVVEDDPDDSEDWDVETGVDSSDADNVAPEENLDNVANLFREAGAE